MSTTTLTSKGQITLPKQVRDRLALKEGERLRVEVGPRGEVVLHRDTQPPLEAVFGALRRLARRPVSTARMRQAVRERAKSKHPR